MRLMKESHHAKLYIPARSPQCSLLFDMKFIRENMPVENVKEEAMIL